jgi:tRNA (mo5U34)-methyltransferase
MTYPMLAFSTSAPVNSSSSRDNVHNVSRDRYGEFDLVLFVGVLYHLRNPMLALDAIRKVTHGRLIPETQMIDDALLTAPGKFRRLSALSLRWRPSF